MNWLQRQVSMRPDEVALRIPGAQLTWAQLVRRVERTAAALQMAGLKPGARVAALADNSVHYVALAFAAMWTGTTLVALNANLTDAQLSWQLSHCGAKLLVVDHSAANRSLRLGDVRFVQIEDLTVSFAADPVKFSPDAAAVMMYTSGTTQEPRLVRLSWRNFGASALSSAMNLEMHADDDWLCCLPMYHVGGLSIMVRGMIYGTASTILDRFDAQEVLEHLQGHVTLISLVPTMLHRLAEAAGSVERLAELTQRGKLRAILLGGAAADPRFIHRCLEAGLPVLQTYGMTETCSQIATMPLNCAQRKIGSSGFPLMGAQIEIRDAAGEPLDSGPGTIWVRGAMVASGYVSPTPEARLRFTGGWFQTGDLGEIDEDGFLWVHGRVDDVIVTGGENVSPEMVERVVAAHPSVLEAAIFGVSDLEWGQRIVGAVVGDVSVEQLDSWCREHLAPHQRPKEWRFKDHLPRTALGKVQRRKLAAE